MAVLAFPPPPSLPNINPEDGTGGCQVLHMVLWEKYDTTAPDSEPTVTIPSEVVCLAERHPWARKEADPVLNPMPHPSHIYHDLIHEKHRSVT